MWGTSSPDDKLTGDLGNVIEATESGDRQLIRVTAEKLSPDNFRLLQQYLPIPDTGYRQIGYTYFVANRYDAGPLLQSIACETQVWLLPQFDYSSARHR